MQVAAHLASPVKCVRLSPSLVADFDIDGVPGRETQNHEVSKTSKELDHKDQPWHTSHARWRSFLQRDSPSPPPLTDPAGLFSIELNGVLPFHTSSQVMGDLSCLTPGAGWRLCKPCKPAD
jgi:hypothetical protein